jgi:hypothetical protein
LPVTKVVFHVVNNGYELVQIPVFIPTEQRASSPARCGRIIKRLHDLRSCALWQNHQSAVGWQWQRCVQTSSSYAASL